MHWRWINIVLFWLFPTAISAQSRYAPTLHRACLDRVNAELSLQLSANRDTCSFLKYRLWGRTDAFASFEVLDEATLSMPTNTWRQEGGKEGRHTENLGYILAEMQFLQRTYPEAQW